MSAKSLSKKIEKVVWRDTLDSLDERGKARLVEAAQPHVMDYLEALPTDGTSFSNEVIRGDIEYRLMKRVTEQGQMCTNKSCKASLDGFGSHALNCPTGSHHAYVHNVLRDHIYEVLKEAKLPNVGLENKDYFTDPERRVDVTSSMEDGKELVLDITGTSPEQTKLIETAARDNASSSLALALSNKEKQYAKLTPLRPFKVTYPLFSLLGALDNTYASLIKRNVRRAAELNEDPEWERRRFAFTKISVLILIHRQRAISFQNRSHTDDSRRRNPRRNGRRTRNC